jgi:hypothetical protein
MSDILDINKTQARVLRSIAYYEEESGKKGGTQYTSSQKVSNEIHVSGSTFNDNITKLHENLMVVRLELEGKTKPYTITEIGQIAWLKCFSIKDNEKLFYKKFPNIITYKIENIIYGIKNPDMRIIRDKLMDSILKYALSNFHIEQKKDTPYSKLILEETTDLSSYHNLVKTSYKRYYNMAHPLLNKSLLKKLNRLMNGFCENYDELKISITERVVFLFYYTLIQAVSNEAHMFKIINEYILPELEFDDEEDYQNTQYKMIQLSSDIVKSKKKFFKIISNNKNINEIIEINLKQLSKYENTDLQQFSKLFK